jgi:FkbM family methyltransferase
MTSLNTLVARARLSIPYLSYQLRRWLEPIIETGGCLRVPTWFGPLYTLARDPEVSRRLREHGYYDVAVTTALWSLLRPGMRVVNVGANIGAFAVLAAQRTQAPVLCFEPDFRNWEALRLNAGLYRNLIPFPFAVGDRNGEVSLIHDTVPGNSALVAATGISQTVRLVTLDQFLHVPFDLLLMDVQGAEGLVLKGLGSRLSTFTFILFEFWPGGLEQTNSSPEEVRELLHQAGFVLQHIVRTSLPDPETEWGQLIQALRDSKDGQGFCNLLAVRHPLAGS